MFRVHSTDKTRSPSFRSLVTLAAPNAMNTSTPRTFTLLLPPSPATTIFAQAPRTNAPPPVYRFDVEPHWFARDGETNRFWYRVGLPRGESEFILVNAEAGTRAPAFDHA